MSRLRRTCTHTHTLLVINVHYYSRACVPRYRPNALFCLLPKLVYLRLACLRSLHFNSSSLRNPARTAIMCLHTQINSILHIHHLEGKCVECAGPPPFPMVAVCHWHWSVHLGCSSALMRLAMHHGNGNEGTIHSLFVISREIVGFSTRRSGFLCGGWSRYICMFSYTHWWNR